MDEIRCGGVVSQPRGMQRTAPHFLDFPVLFWITEVPSMIYFTISCVFPMPEVSLRGEQKVSGFHPLSNGKIHFAVLGQGIMGKN